MGVRDDILKATDKTDKHIQVWAKNVLAREAEPVALMFSAIRGFREMLQDRVRIAKARGFDDLATKIEGWLADLDELSTSVKEL